MRKGGGRVKGHTFENKVAKILTGWSKVSWKRVPASGGWGSKDIASGDIFCAAEFDKKLSIIMPVSIELKKTQAWGFAHFFKDTDSSPVGSWWAQSTEDAKKSKKVPIVIFSKNYQPIFIMMATVTLDKLGVVAAERDAWKRFPQINCLVKGEAITVIKLEDFLSWISFESLLKLNLS